MAEHVHCGWPIYTRQTAQSLTIGIANQKLSDENDEFIIGHLHHVSQEEVNEAQKTADKCHAEKENNIDCEAMEAYDDVSGAALNPELVMKARLEEIQYFKRLGVYRKVPRSKCYSITGKAPIQVRWVDVNKQDNKDPLYRSRLVAKDFRQGTNPA